MCVCPSLPTAFRQTGWRSTCFAPYPDFTSIYAQKKHPNAGKQARYIEGCRAT